MSRWILTIAASVLLIAPALAQNQPLACQVDKAAGLNWKDRRWEVTEFNPTRDKFILVLTGKSKFLTPESVAEVLGDGNVDPICHAGMEENSFSCTAGSGSGYSLLFSITTMKGAIAKLFGGISSDHQRRDSVSVATFTCQPF